MPLQRDRGYRVDPLVKVEPLDAPGVFSHIIRENQLLYVKTWVRTGRDQALYT